MAGGTASLLSLLLLLLATHLTGEEVRVFSLQPDIWEPPRDDVYIRFNMSNQQVAASLNHFTVCSRVYLTALTTIQVLLSYATAEDFSNAIMMYIIDGSHFFRYNNKPQAAIERLEVATVLRQWRHYCHVLSGDTYTVYVDGVALATSPIQVDNRLLPLNGTFVVGQEQDGLSRGFDRFQILKGYVTQINLWNHGLSSATVEMIANCKKNPTGNIFSSDTNVVELLNVQEQTVPLPSICADDEDFVIFPEERTFTEARRICHLIGSEMYAPFTKTKSLEVQRTLWNEGFCSKEDLWIGITDVKEDGIWRSLLDDRTVTDVCWGPGQPDETRQENCIIMTTETASWNDFSCQSYMACVSCGQQLNTPLYLRGLCKEFKTEILFEVLGYSSGKPFFHGFYGLMIVKSEGELWVLLDTVTNKTLAFLSLASDTLYPLGKHYWTLKDSLCKQPVGSRIELSLSACHDGEYMCDDGECIDLDSRCDAKDDCSDETDEYNCSLVQIPSGYRRYTPPRNMEDSAEPLQPHLKFQFLRFLKIEDTEQAIHLEFIISTEWVDTRLKYLNLRQDIHANKLSAYEREHIWHPELEFPNVKDGEKKLIKENFFASKINVSLPVHFGNKRMGTVYGGNAAKIIHQQHYSGWFVCDFDVFRYPFDMQHCSVLVQLSSVGRDCVAFTTAKLTLEFGQDSKLAIYVISGFFAKEKNTRSHESLIEIGYTLTRHSTLIVLSIYLPSLMLLFIGCSTLYVKVHMLQVRLTVSLTTLLVLYTFFNQASSSLPNTAYIKMIDVWFFFCTILLFFIILIHVVVECLDTEVLTDSACKRQHRGQEVTFYKAVLSSVDGKEYSVVKDLLAPKEPTFPCSCMEISLEAAGAP